MSTSHWTSAALVLVFLVGLVCGRDESILVISYHHTGHVTPMAVLAKQLRVAHGFHVQLTSFEYVREEFEHKLANVGVEFIGAGTIPWNRTHDHLITAKVFEDSNILNTVKTMGEVMGTYQEVMFAELEQVYQHRPLPDLIVVDCMAIGGLDFAMKHSIPRVLVTTSGLQNINFEDLHFSIPSHFPTFLRPNVPRNSFDRIINYASMVFAKHTLMKMMSSTGLAIRAKNNISSINVLRDTEEVPLTIVCTSWGLEYAASVPPYLQLVGSLFDPEMNSAKPMTDELREWLDSSSRPVVYVSTGTNARFPETQLAEVVAGLNALNYNILWSMKPEKYPYPIPKSDSHVMRQSFVPQAEVLAHPNVKLFISHCGQNSAVEAILNAVPIVAIPFAGDQPINAGTLKQAGGAETLDRATMTASEIKEKVDQVMDNYDTYEKSMRKLRALVKSAGGKERAAELIALYLEFGGDQWVPLNVNRPFWEYYELDILAAQLLSVAIVMSLFYCCVRCCCCRAKKDVVVKKKTQ